MLISKEKEFIYITVPKCASNSIYRTLEKVYKCEPYLFGHPRIVPSGFGNYFKFSVVRNPYSRAISAWYYCTQNIRDLDGKGKERIEIFKEICKDCSEPGMFFNWLLNSQKGQEKFHSVPVLRTQTWQLSQERIDRALHLETLSEGIKTLPFYNNELLTFRRKNVSHRKETIHYLNTESIHWINEIYKNDFYSFGYNMINV